MLDAPFPAPGCPSRTPHTWFCETRVGDGAPPAQSFNVGPDRGAQTDGRLGTFTKAVTEPITFRLGTFLKSVVLFSNPELLAAPANKPPK